MTLTKAQLANEAWEALLTSHSVLMKAFAAEDTWQELSMREYDVLYALAKQRMPINVSELHKWILLSQPGLSRMVDRLAVRGLLKREMDETDRRNVKLSLTEAGKQCQRRAGRKHARQVARVMNQLEVDELEKLQSLCSKLSDSNRKGGSRDV